MNCYADKHIPLCALSGEFLFPILQIVKVEDRVPPTLRNLQCIPCSHITSNIQMAPGRQKRGLCLQRLPFL